MGCQEVLKILSLFRRSDAGGIGNWLFAASEAVFAPRTLEEKLRETAALSDETLCIMAKQALRVLDVPVDRLPVVEGQYFMLRESSRDRLEWCRHLEMMENRRHMLTQATIFRTAPPRICVCPLREVQSATPNADCKTVFEAFKKANCEFCQDREPFRRSAALSSDDVMYSGPHRTTQAKSLPRHQTCDSMCGASFPFLSSTICVS